jgi:putative nucleotidyltransferase with HDIG domain
MPELNMEVKVVKDIVCYALGSFARPFDSTELIRNIIRSLRVTTGSMRGDLLIYQSDMDILFFSETSSSDSGSNEQAKINIADSQKSAAVKALKSGYTVLVDDVRESGLQSLSPGSKTLLAVPVIYSDCIHGVLNLEHNEVSAYDTGTVTWIEVTCSILASLLEHSYQSERIFRLNQKLIDSMTGNLADNDPQYRAHAERVSSLAVAIAQKLGLSKKLVEAVQESGYLHDIGKAGVSQNILVKPGNLTDDEFQEIKKHPILGRFMLKPLGFQSEVIEGVVSHHERWDGKGYPRGLKGDQIPITGRILAVAEAFDVMTSEQPYREKMSKEEALKDIQNQAGMQFDPLVVKALVSIDFQSR